MNHETYIAPHGFTRRFDSDGTGFRAKVGLALVAGFVAFQLALAGAVHVLTPQHAAAATVVAGSSTAAQPADIGRDPSTAAPAADTTMVYWTYDDTVDASEAYERYLEPQDNSRECNLGLGIDVDCIFD